MKKINLLNQISPDQALMILKDLAARDKQYKLIIEQLAKEFLSNVDIEDVASDVFDALDMLDVDDLFSSSGKTRYGYVEPSERAWEMFEEALEPFMEQLKKYKELFMSKEAKFYCMGILKGINDYENDSCSEFADWATDAPGEYFTSVLKEWKKDQENREDITEMKNYVKENFSDFK